MHESGSASSHVKEVLTFSPSPRNLNPEVWGSGAPAEMHASWGVGARLCMSVRGPVYFVVVWLCLLPV